MEEHLDLRNFSGQTWDNSQALLYLQNLPISNSHESPVTAMRYLLPRQNVFTFGFENAFTQPPTYFSCKICQSVLKRHEIKSHMLSKHPNLEEATVGSKAPTSPLQVRAKSKRSSRKNKKKVVPPPNAPPPPLFSNIPIKTVPIVETSVLPPKQIPQASQILHSINTVTAPPSTPLPENAASYMIKLQRTPPCQTSSGPLPDVSVLKPNSDRHKHKRLKNTKDSDKNYDSLDHSDGGSMRAIAFACQSTSDGNAIPGHSTKVDSLLALDRLSKELTKQSKRPAPAPKTSSYVTKEAKDGYKYIEVIYDENFSTGFASTQSGCVNKIKRENSVLKGIEVTDSPNIINVPLLPNLAEPSTLYSLHPKPMTMSRGFLRRVGSGILFQNFSPLERQRMDLQAVVDQYKQLQIPAFNKTLLLNSNKSNKVF